MPGIEDVARIAGVSSATVSRALSGRGHVSDATRARVKSAARELGYVVSSSASSLASGRTKNIGVVIPFLNRWFFGAVIEGAEQVLMEQGYDLTLYNLAGDGTQRDYVFQSSLLRQRVDAVLAISLELRGPEVSSLLDIGKPVVAVGGPIPGVRTLSIDDVAVARLATEHLLALGHRSIAHIGGSEDAETDFHLYTDRRGGYEAALHAAGITPDPQLFATADFTLQDGHRAARQLLGNPRRRPTAIFAASDEMAIGAMLAARDLGLSVPGDVSVIGIDDHDLADFFGLTTVAQFPALQGRMATELLLHELQPRVPRSGEPQLRVGDAPLDVSAPLAPAQLAANTPLPFELVVRSSTARPRADRPGWGGDGASP